MLCFGYVYYRREGKYTGPLITHLTQKLIYDRGKYLREFICTWCVSNKHSTKLQQLDSIMVVNHGQQAHV